MKITLIAPSHLPARRANTVQVMKMAQALRQTGWQVQVIVPGLPPAPVSRVELAQHYGLAEASFPVEWLPRRGILRGYDFGWQAVRRARANGAQIIYTRHFQSAAFASLSGLPTVLEIHDLPTGGAAAALVRLYLAGKGAARLVFISNILARDFQLKFMYPKIEQLAQVAPDGIDLERYCDLPEPAAARLALVDEGKLADLPENSFTAGYTGHLYAGRGVELLLELAARLPQVHFLLVGGEAQDIQRVQAQAQAAGLANLHLTGFVPNAGLPRYQAACDTLLMPYQRQVSASSGGDIARYLSPMKMFEYMASGRPILSSSLPVLREVLNENNAVLLEPDNVFAWEQALIDLMQNPDRGAALAAQARRDVQRYTWIERARLIFDELEGKHGRA